MKDKTTAHALNISLKMDRDGSLSASGTYLRKIGEHADSNGTRKIAKPVAKKLITLYREIFGVNLVFEDRERK